MNTSEAILRAIDGENVTFEVIVARTGLPGPIVRHGLWYLVYAQRRVTCDRMGRYRKGTPPTDWPRMTVIHQ